MFGPSRTWFNPTLRTVCSPRVGRHPTIMPLRSFLLCEWSGACVRTTLFGKRCELTYSRPERPNATVKHFIHDSPLEALARIDFQLSRPIPFAPERRVSRPLYDQSERPGRTCRMTETGVPEGLYLYDGEYLRYSKKSCGTCGFRTPTSPRFFLLSFCFLDRPVKSGETFGIPGVTLASPPV